MKAFISLLLILSVLAVLEAVCTTPKIRKEIRELTEDEYFRYIKAALALNKRTSTTTLSLWEKFTKQHYDGAQVEKRIHGTPAFLPWHRKFIKMYELELQKIDPTVNLPYWDWSQDGDEPHLSPILTPLYMGGNGNRNAGRILDNGPFNYTQLIYYDKHPLRRDYDQGNKISPFASTTDIKAIMANSKFSKMCNQLEGVHGAPHTFIGNWDDFGVYTSPNDPIFYLHHAFVDLVWAKWQEKFPKANQYEGDDYRLKVQLTDKMYSYTDTVNSTINIRTDPYCYDYPEYPRTITAVRTNKLVARDLKKNGLINDVKLNSVIKDLTFDEAIAKLEALEGTFASDINSINNIGDDKPLPTNNGDDFIPKRTPLPDRYIDMMHLDKAKIRRFEAQQIKIRQLFKRLHPVKDKLVK